VAFLSQFLAEHILLYENKICLPKALIDLHYNRFKSCNNQ
jgi:hypothetical protein